MNVEPQVQSKLLDLAGVDAELTRITHRRGALPEQQEVERLEAERISRKDASVAVEIQIDDIDRDIRKLEGEVDAVRQREDRDRTLLQRRVGRGEAAHRTRTRTRQPGPASGAPRRRVARSDGAA